MCCGFLGQFALVLGKLCYGWGFCGGGVSAWGVWTVVCTHLHLPWLSLSGFFMSEQRCQILNWNVRGLNGAARRKVVHDLAVDTSCTIVCLQETKLAVIQDIVVGEILGRSSLPTMHICQQMGLEEERLLRLMKIITVSQLQNSGSSQSQQN